jgi:hypothetical protein
MVRAQAAQVIPETGRSTRSGAVVFMPGLRSRAPDGVGQRLGLHHVRVVFHGRAWRPRSTVALVTPGVAESLRSTLREQLPQVIPPTFIFRVCAAIPI